MKTTGFGLAILEILTLAGVIIETKHEGWTEWTLSMGWENKKVFVAMDGLSIDRHWSFSRILTEVPLSFTKSYRQCLIFQRALTVVTEISGPLYNMGFHMLQSIFVIFANFMDVCQNVIEWKKIKQNEVSECYELCRNMCFIDLEESSRLAWDLFLENKAATIIQLLETFTTNSNYLAIELAKMYSDFINEQANSSTDKFRIVTFNFIRVASMYKIFHDDINDGCIITQEFLTHEFLGIFLLLKKLHYVEFILSTIETNYKRNDYDVLQDICMNLVCRYCNENLKQTVIVSIA